MRAFLKGQSVPVSNAFDKEAVEVLAARFFRFTSCGVPERRAVRWALNQARVAVRAARLAADRLR